MKSTFISDVRKVLSNSIDNHVARKHEFANNPKQDFKRNRKLSLANVLKGTLLLGSGSVDKELLEYFDYSTDTATGSAFTQQRDKLSSSIFKSLFKQFTNHLNHYKTFMGYRVLAIDGTDLHIPPNPNDLETYFQSTPGSKGFNLVHVNSLYDLVNRIYLDGRIQPGRELHERKALIEMMQESNLGDNVLIIGDRGYESYNVFSHIMKKGWKFLIRVKDKSKNSMLG